MSRREKITSCFAGLLAFSQIGACEVTQSQDNSMATFGEITIKAGDEINKRQILNVSK